MDAVGSVEKGRSRRVLAAVVAVLALVASLAVGRAGAAAAASGPPAPVAAQWSVQPAVDAAQRLVGVSQSQRFRFTAEQPTKAGEDHYRISADRDHIVIGGTSPAVILRGLGAYLADVAHLDISWNGQSLASTSPFPLPDHEIYQRANVEHRFAFNDTDDGYTGAYRSWPDWQHTIDVLALHGINEVFMPVGAEAVYLDTFEQFGYSQGELLSWVPQPAHQPWWLLQNMSAFPSPMSEDVLDKRAALGAKIADRLHELGMTPVLPGYFGTVPPDFVAKNPGAEVVPQGSWVGFARPDWLDPTNPVFDKVADAFYAASAKRFGASGMYKMDLLHEGGRAGSVDVAAASRAVEAALQRNHPGATWAILGWQSNPRPETIAAIDRSKMLIVDGLADRYDGLDRETSWNGTPYAFGSIWNFGGHTTMGANIGVWNQRYWQWKAKSDSALNGIAVLPEGSANNPVAFDFLTSLAWADGPQDMDAWYAAWSARRYGATDGAANRAWQVLGNTAYAMPSDGWSEAQDGLFAAQPSLTATSAATWSPGSMRYDATRFAQALPALLGVQPGLRASSAYRYDLMDVARQVLSNHSRELLPRIKAAYDAKDRDQFQALAEEWMDSMTLLDEVTGTNAQTMLGPWLQDVARYASTSDQEADLDYDARSILTIWGNRAGFDGGLGDYANREWSGLVSGYYAKRWQAYFAELDSALAENRAPRPIDWFAFGDGWARDEGETARLDTAPHGDIHAVATAVVDFLATHPAPVTVATTGSDSAVTADRPARVNVTVTNPNPFTTLTDVTADVLVPAGLAAEPVGETTWARMEPGQSAEAAFTVTLTDPQAAPLVGTLTARATYTAGDRQVQASAPVRLLTAVGVASPNRTVSFNDAVFGQRGEDYAILGGGADLWGGTNEFGAIYRTDALASGGRVTTKVLEQDRTGPWARAGIVVRDTMDQQGSRGFLNLAVTPDHGCVLSWDSDDNGSLNSYRNVDGLTAPMWLRLSRTGDQYLGECSTDGATWTQVGTATVPSDASVDAGLFMTAAGPGRGLAQFHGFEVVVPPPPSGPGAGSHFLSDLPFESSVGGYGPWERDMNNGETAAGDGGPLVLDGTTYAKGLGTNSVAEATFFLGGGCTRFTSVVGIDDSMNRPDAHGDVAFEVYADATRVYASGTVLAGETPRQVDVDVTGAQRLRLVVDKVDADNWWDRADWADATITCS